MLPNWRGGGEGTTDKVKEEKERINNNNKNKRELVKNQKEEEKKEEMKGGKFKKWVERMDKTHETKKKKLPSSLFPLLPPPLPHLVYPSDSPDMQTMMIWILDYRTEE